MAKSKTRKHADIISSLSFDEDGNLTGFENPESVTLPGLEVTGQSIFNGNVGIRGTTIFTGSTIDIKQGGVYLGSDSDSFNGTAIGGSATALIDGDSDFTLADGVANGIHYELDNTDMADWNQGGVALTTAGGIFTHHQTQAATYTVAANTGSVLAGPITIDKLIL